MLILVKEIDKMPPERKEEFLKIVNLYNYNSLLGKVLYLKENDSVTYGVCFFEKEDCYLKSCLKSAIEYANEKKKRLYCAFDETIKKYEDKINWMYDELNNTMPFKIHKQIISEIIESGGIVLSDGTYNNLKKYKDFGHFATSLVAESHLKKLKLIPVFYLEYKEAIDKELEELSKSFRE